MEVFLDGSRTKKMHTQINQKFIFVRKKNTEVIDFTQFGYIGGNLAFSYDCLLLECVNVACFKFYYYYVVTSCVKFQLRLYG